MVDQVHAYMNEIAATYDEVDQAEINHWMDLEAEPSINNRMGEYLISLGDILG